MESLEKATFIKRILYIKSYEDFINFEREKIEAIQSIFVGGKDK